MCDLGGVVGLDYAVAAFALAYMIGLLIGRLVR